MWEKRVEVADDTVNISKLGAYNLGNERYYLSKARKTEYYSVTDLISIRMKSMMEMSAPGRVFVYNESVIDTILKYKGRDILGVLNFASAYKPGGGFLNGAMAQEEAIAYCSNLYTQLCNGGEKFYEIGNSCDTKAYKHCMLYSYVTVFKDNSYNLVKPRKINVLTSAAVNRGGMIANGEDVSNTNKIMYRRMRYILELFMKQGNRSIVIGAFGCGVFQNNNVEIAEIWKKLLYDEGYIYYFDRVIFTVLEDSNNSFSVFNDVFDRKTIQLLTRTEQITRDTLYNTSKGTLVYVKELGVFRYKVPSKNNTPYVSGYVTLARLYEVLEYKKLNDLSGVYVLENILSKFKKNFPQDYDKMTKGM